MGAHPLDMPAEQVRMPGEWGMAFTVAQASGEQLTEQLQASLDVIAEQVVSTGFAPTKDGLTPEGWFDHANMHRHLHAAESVVRRNERLVRTIRREQADRQSRASADRTKGIADTRERLDQIILEAPAEAQRAIAHAADVRAASERIRQIVADLRLMAGSTGLTDQIEGLREGVRIAAVALGKPAPDMPRAPDGLPTKSEVAAALAAFIGKSGFDATFKPSSGAGGAAELARKLKSLEG